MAVMMTGAVPDVTDEFFDEKRNAEAILFVAVEAASAWRDLPALDGVPSEQMWDGLPPPSLAFPHADRALAVSLADEMSARAVTDDDAGREPRTFNTGISLQSAFDLGSACLDRLAEASGQSVAQWCATLQEL